MGEAGDAVKYQDCQLLKTMKKKSLTNLQWCQCRKYLSLKWNNTCYKTAKLYVFIIYQIMRLDLSKIEFCQWLHIFTHNTAFYVIIILYFFEIMKINYQKN